MKTTFLIIVIIIVLPLLVGMLLPGKRVFIKTAQFKSNPQQIWDIITDIKEQEEWRNDVKSIEMISTKEGVEKWTEIPKKGQPITFQVKTYQEPNRYDIEIVDSNISGHWEGRITKENGITTVEFKEIINVKNPYFKIISYLFIDFNEIMEVYMNNLKNKLGEK